MAQAIENISEVVQPTTLIEKTLTTNGEYSASDDDATGYSKVTVNVESEYNAKFISGSGTQFATFADLLEEVAIPEGFKTFYTTASQASLSSATRMKKIILPSTFETITSNQFTACTLLEKIIINKPEGSITGAPWGATNAQVIWTG